MSEVLHLVGVSLIRGGRTLLQDLDWSVSESDRWVVLGPNGAGKSTLLQIASGRLHPTRGTVDILDERLGRVDVFELRPRIGLSSSTVSARIPYSEKVLDAVITASYAVTGRWREDYDELDSTRAQGLLDAMGVGDLAPRTYGTLSDGERKRVTIARALMSDPELLFLDEPTAGLDLGGREDLLRRLSRLAADPEAPTTVIVTHHVEEIPVGYTHALLLKEGRIVAAGPLESTLTEENLERAFGQPFVLTRADGRWSAHARY